MCEHVRFLDLIFATYSSSSTGILWAKQKRRERKERRGAGSRKISLAVKLGEWKKERRGKSLWSFFAENSLTDRILPQTTPNYSNRFFVPWLPFFACESKDSHIIRSWANPAFRKVAPVSLRVLCICVCRPCLHGYTTTGDVLICSAPAGFRRGTIPPYFWVPLLDVLQVRKPRLSFGFAN